MTKRPDLHTAVDSLIQRTRIKVYREDTKKSIWQTIPSLWEQLETSAMWRGGGSGGAGAFGSRPTISTGVVSLIIEISEAAAEGAQEHGEPQHSVPGNLRAIAEKLIHGTDIDQIDWWQSALTRWVREARTELKLDPVRPRWARGIACPDCGATTTTAKQDGETVRTPAMAITWTGPDDDEHHPDTDWKVRAVECRCCGSVWFRGVDLDTLVAQMLRANQTRETLTS